MTKIIKPISDTEILNKTYKREVHFEGINSLSLTTKSAEIIWKVYILDDNGQIVDHPNLIQGRIQSSLISNMFRVTAEGVTITPEYVKSLNPKNENELDIDYEYRIKDLYDQMFANGFPEFDFYWTALFTNPLPSVISQSIVTIDELKGYDKVKKNQ